MNTLTAEQRIENIISQLPELDMSGLAAALGARAYTDTGFLGGDVYKSNDLIRALCGSGVYIYAASRFAEALEGGTGLIDLRHILCILRPETEQDESLIDYVRSFEDLCGQVLSKGRYDPCAVACSLLYLSDLDEMSRYDSAYGKLLSALDQAKSNLVGTRDLQRDISAALELLNLTDSCIADDCERFEEDPLLYKALLAAALSACVGDIGFCGGAFPVFGSACDDAPDDLEEDPEYDPLDALDWDEFYSYQE